jgi:glycosyltransferase involved in cell wall biosynthesis
MAKVDVLVPCYNYARYLTDCVRSVLDQSIQDVRVLVIDDASSDNSLEVANRLAADDRRVEVISHARNRGHIATYNEGITWASGDYFLLLSADDLLVSGALERAVDVLENNPDVVLTHGQCLSWDDQLPTPHVAPIQGYTWSRHDLLGEMCTTGTNLVPTPTAIVRTSTQKAIGGYRASLPHAGDMEMWLRFAANGSVARIDAVQAIYRRHPAAMSNAYFAEMLSDYRQCQLAFDSFFDEYNQRLGASRSLQAVARRALARRVFGGGIGLLRRGRPTHALRAIHEAFQMDRRLRYLPPLWQLFRIPSAEGRQRAFSAIRASVARRLGWPSRGSSRLPPKREGSSGRAT